jgi:murein DD-endopeptidase MepM/ murein hydrolase activator NlpD
MAQLIPFKSWWRWGVGVVWMLFLSSNGWTQVSSPDQQPAPVQAQDNFFEYRLRAGESLSEVARVFQIPATELAQMNRIADPTRLGVGQSLRIPNVFARQVAQLQAEHDQFVEEKEQLGKELASLQQAYANLGTDLRKAEEEKTALTAQLVSTVRWQRSALALGILLIAVTGWGLLTRSARVKLLRRVSLLTQENAALISAKEKYRQAAAQLELRYQKLYRGREEIPTKFVADGIALLQRAFTEGSARIEQLLAGMKAEREKAEQLLQAESGVGDRFLHLFRGFLLRRDRLKYHEV